MKLDLRNRASLMACVLAAILVPSAAGATTYGDTVFAASVPITGCTDVQALSLPLDVSVSSRIYVSARATYSAVDTNNHYGYAWAELRDAGDTTTLASSQRAAAGSFSGELGFLDSNGLLHAGTSNEDPLAAIFVAAPGNYTLKMHVQGVCGAGSAPFIDVTLSYLLLSSAFDRVYADGFEAMLGDGRALARVA